MINLKHTYIKNEDGELRDLFIVECEKQDIRPYNNKVLTCTNKPFLEVYTGDIVATDAAEPEAKQIYLADLSKKQGKTVDDKQVKPSTKEIRVGNLGQWSDSELENELSTRNGEDVISEVKPRMKVEYVKAVDSIFDLQDGFDLGLLYTRKDSEYIKIITEDRLLVCLYNSNVYHEVETEIDLKQEQIKLFMQKIKDESPAMVGHGLFLYMQEQGMLAEIK